MSKPKDWQELRQAVDTIVRAAALFLTQLNELGIRVEDLEGNVDDVSALVRKIEARQTRPSPALSRRGQDQAVRG